VAGTGVTVRRIAGWYRLGLNAEEIADRIGSVTVGQVYAALAYYHANRDEIDADIAAEETLTEALERSPIPNVIPSVRGISRSPAREHEIPRRSQARFPRDDG
jgi:uncharacterized protein (DUF433 family)